VTARVTDNGNASTTSAPVTVTVVPAGSNVNVALQSNGGVASASSTYSSSFPPASAINGNRPGNGWGSGAGGWADGTGNAYPDWLQVRFAAPRQINRIDVFTVQDNYASPVNPTPTMTFTRWGITDFDVQVWNGSAWITVPGGAVTGNDKVWRAFQFADVVTDRVRVLVKNALASSARITELEAWMGSVPPPVNVALAQNGGIATASSTLSAAFPAASVINGDRKGTGWASGSGGWADATGGTYPDWLQVTFAGQRTINRIDVFTLQDNYASPVDPTPTMTFSKWGITSFDVQTWNGSSWITVPGGAVTGNNKVWRTFTFANISTDRIRVYVRAALAGSSRIAEVEAWSA
jgi:hypothetical protein